MRLLSIAIWLPIVSGVLLLAFGRDERADAVRWSALIASLASFAVTSGIVTAKLASEAISADQRTASARSSRPNASSSTPETIGSQIATLRRGMLFLLVAAALRCRTGRRGRARVCQVMRPMTPTIMTSAYQ